MIRATASIDGPPFTFNATVSGLAIYLDNWAVIDLAEGDPSRRRRFVERLHSGADLLFSVSNAAELSGPQGRSIDIVRKFLDEIGPHWFPVELDPVEVVTRELNGERSAGQCIEGRACAGAEIGLDMDRLAYFALSIFWRAGAHEWTSRLTRKAKYSIDLGDYLNPIGAYLLGGIYPEGVALMITAATDFLSQGYAFMPAPTVGLSLTAVGLLTSGIHFGLFLRRPLPPLYARLCSVSAPRRPIFARNLHDDTMHAAGRLYSLGRPARNMRDGREHADDA